MRAERPEPGYRRLHAAGELGDRAGRAYDLLRSCTVCPRKCGVNRLEDERGFCRTGRLPVISGYGPHFGEEPPLAGRGGPGTIFISSCNLACRFCQNAGISRPGEGSGTVPEKFADMMLCLQQRGCENINIVSPTHVVPQLIHALEIAAGRGLGLPVVYNTGGYDTAGTFRLLDGIVDIYLPDAKYGSNGIAAALSQAPGYVETMKDALREMHRQVGDLVITGGIAVRGLLVRHLVLPGNLAGSDTVLPWIAAGLSRDTYVNVMDQYRWPGPVVPEEPGTGPGYGELLQRPVTAREYAQAIRWAREAGLHRGFPSYPV